MASIKNILFLFAILVSSTVTLAQGPSNGSDEHSSIPPHDGSSEEPPAPVPSSAPGRFDHFPFKAPKFDFDLSGFFSGGPRQKRAVDRRVINCNYARDGMFTCTGCHTVRRCYPFNKGTESTCTGFFQYCNNGQCSRNKGPLCDVTTTSSPTTASTSTTGSSSTTGTSGTSTTQSSTAGSTSTTQSSTSGSSTT